MVPAIPVEPGLSAKQNGYDGQDQAGKRRRRANARGLQNGKLPTRAPPRAQALKIEDLPTLGKPTSPV